MKPYLALFRAGASSLHPKAVQRLGQQNFDYALSWFGDAPPEAPGAAFVHMQKGAKWPGLEQTLALHWPLISQYKYVWLPDDDLLCVPEHVSRMFTLCDELALELAQPALTVDSYFTHLVTLRHSEFRVRFTNFVEIMAPVFSIEMLARVFPTLAGNISGYGLDGVWPRLSRLGKIAVLDEVPVTHTRPVGGPNYLFNAKAGRSPVHEDWLESARYFVDQRADFHINYGGLLTNGQAICLGASADEIEQLLSRLIGSTEGMRITATQMTSYLANHMNFAKADLGHDARYPRSVVRLVMNQALESAGITFPNPPAAKTNAAAAATANVPLGLAA